MSSEYIFEINDALYDHETGNVCMMPKFVGKLIRCKDCKHWEKTWTNDWAKDYHYCIMVDGVRKADFYCADAERRNDED